MNSFIVYATALIPIVSALSVDLALSSCPNTTALTIKQTVDGTASNFTAIPAEDGLICNVQIVATSPETSLNSTACFIVAVGDDTFDTQSVITPADSYSGDPVGWLRCLDTLNPGNGDLEDSD
ncbi:hypothetical protein COCMIDRAFT_97816 [Bipolaris oryzae ATCC 44560]|uniref:Ubiquitin 3 binding protein But2 C-terminal domain-containing protein n=1 Tax=Bipolaris oryzae ATCC 44560 TaxID=930090 RepID=W6ZAU8_COCMI|nr:uncharacterized protein COCMIDRAFT_97816 [Bipolaris oryzae ATCC 44560]EUC44594.1 hypothetical protein COCMIDRAFT_97816 [Bipolaris oryzae ATCC 44560]